jgi:O-antigen/teichoic acid export membrane protein
VIMLKKYYPESEFARNVLTLMTGNTIAQAIPIGISPILTRLYAPEEFGVWALYLAITAFIGVIASGRYELAVMLPEQDKEAVNILCLSVVIAFAASMLSLLIIVLFKDGIIELLNNQQISPWLYFVPLSIFLTGLYQALTQWTTRKKQFKSLVYANVGQSSSTAIVSLSMGFWRFGASGLVLGSLSGQIIATLRLGVAFLRRNNRWKNHISKDQMIEQAKRYQNFPKINSLHALGDMIQSSGVSFLISSFFGGAILGFYSHTLRILKAPSSLIGNSTAQVFYQRASEIYSIGGDLQPLVKKTMLHLTVIALPIFIFVAFTGPTIFAFIFGEQWRIAGEYAQILSPWIFMNFVVSPVSQLPIIVDKQKEIFYISLIGNLLILFSIFYGGYVVKDVKMGFYLLSFLQVMYLGGVILWMNKISQCRINASKSHAK